MTSSRSRSAQVGRGGGERGLGAEGQADLHRPGAQRVEERAGVAELDVDDAAVGAGVGEVVEAAPPGCRP